MEQIVTLPKRSEEGSINQANRTVNTETLGLNTAHIREASKLYLLTKRALDIILCVIGIIVLSPVFLMIALYIKFDDGGRILHFREIIGQHGRRFYALKFRTMIAD